MIGVLALMAAGCGGSAGDAGDVASVVPLARTGEWRPDLEGAAATGEGLGGLLEIAYTAQEAQALWQENVPDGLPERADRDRPSAPGLYAGLETVDLEQQVVAAWHAGEGSDCPAWLRGVGSDADGRPVVEVGEIERASCHEDFEPYSMIVAIPRGQVPDPDDLPLRGVIRDDIPSAVRFVAYNAE